MMRVTVAYADAVQEAIIELELADGSTVDDAIGASGLRDRLPQALDATEPAIHGQRAIGATPLRDGDRVELVRPLIADPKTVRRRRAEERPLPKLPPRRKRSRTS